MNYAHIEEAILGGTTARRGETVMSRGEGCWLWDTEGKRYLDLTSAQGITMLGHCHPALTQAIADQAQQLISCPNFLYNDTRARFAEKMVEILPDHLNHLFISNSGAEAIDGALKFARLATGRTGIVATMRSFHGRTVGAVSLTWEPKYRKAFQPLMADVSHVPYNNLEKLEAVIDDQTAAVFLEPIQGEGGVNMGQAEFLQGAQQLCRERGALLVIDEIQTGFGRTGRWFGHQHFDLTPDMICMAKGLGAGFPMGAIAYSGQVRESFFMGAHGTTFGGNPLACAAGLAALEAYQAGLIDHAAQMGELLQSRLRTALREVKLVREVRGMGLMVGIELRQKVGRYLKALMEDHGVLALPAGSNVLRLLPPLIINEDEIEQGVQAIEAVLREG